MKPSQKCKAAGLKSLAELVALSGIPERTLIDWFETKPAAVNLMILGAVCKKAERALTQKNST